MISPSGILDDIKVVELATYIFAPASATVMSDFGAKVIKIERPKVGDTYRNLFTLRPMPASEINYNWLLDSRNKRSLAIDVGSPEGREVVMKLVADADVFVTNYRPGILKKLGLAYEDLQAPHPRLIYAHATGFGEENDNAEKAGFDQTAYWAGSGLMFALHNADADPCPSVCGMGDHPSAMSLFGGIMLALYNRQRTGKGTKVSSSLQANGFWSNACQIQAAICGAEFYPRRKRTTTYNPLVNHYISKDGKRFILCLIHPERDWSNICQAIGRPDLEHDPRFVSFDTRSEHSQALIEILDGILVQKTLAEWAEIFAKRGLIWNSVTSSQEIAADEKLLASDFFVDVEHPQYGRTRTVDSPIKLRGVTKAPPRPAPEIGEHSAEVLRELGYSDAEIDAFKQSGTISQAANSK